MPGLQVVIGYRVIDPKSGVHGIEICLPGPCIWGSNVNCHALAPAPRDRSASTPAHLHASCAAPLNLWASKTITVPRGLPFAPTG